MRKSLPTKKPNRGDAILDEFFRAYYVWPDFPSISISGDTCALSCRHCDAQYLKDMETANSPEELVKLTTNMKSKGARGILISGGCDTEGSILNLKEFLPAIKEAHEMGLIIKLHTGLVNQDTAKAIAGAGVDIASMEMVGEAETVKHIFGIIASPEDYLATFKDLQEAGVPHICPHVCVGLHDGELKGEFKAIEMLASEVKVSTLAIIVLRPTKGTVLESIAPPSGEDVKKVVSHARVLLPNTKIIMGSLRPRASLESRLDIEINALDGGVDGIEVPSNELLTEVRNRGMKVKKIEAYGVLPVEYEERVRTSTVY